jgi:hypothetical protein
MPKSYSHFKYQDVTNLGLTLKQSAFIKNIVPIAPSDFLKLTLELNTIRVLNTEKAKSEFIIAPILYEIARKNITSVTFFSGYSLDVNKDLGLKGFCDFLFSKVPDSLFVNAPIFCIVEAKNDNLEKGIPQCVAEMFAARMLNEREKKPIDIIYGCVTTGYQWQFLKLEGQIVQQDTTIYSLIEINAVLGILQSMIEN